MKGPLNTCSKDQYSLIEQSDLNTLRPLQLVIMFLVHRPHPFLENVKFQKDMGKMPASDFFKKPDFRNKYWAVTKVLNQTADNLPFISENLQEMNIVHSTDRYTLIEQSVNHKYTLIEQSLHCCFVAEFRPPASKTKLQMTRNIKTNWSGLMEQSQYSSEEQCSSKLIDKEIW